MAAVPFLLPFCALAEKDVQLFSGSPCSLLGVSLQPGEGKGVSSRRNGISPSSVTSHEGVFGREVSKER